MSRARRSRKLKRLIAAEQARNAERELLGRILRKKPLVLAIRQAINLKRP